MRAVRLAARGFRNLADFELDLPPAGGVFLGPNGHGKTSLLEALYYPVLFRSFRAAADQDVARWDGLGVRALGRDNGRRATGEGGGRRVVSAGNQAPEDHD